MPRASTRWMKSRAENRFSAETQKCGFSDRNCFGLEFTLVKLQRPPPDIRIFSAGLAAWSITSTDRPRRPASMAHISPAAPAPRTRTSTVRIMGASTGAAPAPGQPKRRWPKISSCRNVGFRGPAASYGRTGPWRRRRAEENPMRFMMLMYPGPNAETEENPVDGHVDLFNAMMAFNQRMIDAKVLISGDGLKPTSKGKRVRFGRGQPKIIDGPFTETKEILGGFWMIEAASLDEAVAWAAQAPCPE